jgi:hypothetical protein
MTVQLAQFGLILTERTSLVWSGNTLKIGATSIAFFTRLLSFSLSLIAY